MTGPPAQVTEPGPLRQVGVGIGRAAVLIGGITVLARLVGFGRQLVFAHTVGNHCLGTAYATANQVPNIIYAIETGTALIIERRRREVRIARINCWAAGQQRVSESRPSVVLQWA